MEENDAIEVLGDGETGNFAPLDLEIVLPGKLRPETEGLEPLGQGGREEPEMLADAAEKPPPGVGEDERHGQLIGAHEDGPASGVAAIPLQPPAAARLQVHGVGKVLETADDHAGAIAVQPEGGTYPSLGKEEGQGFVARQSLSAGELARFLEITKQIHKRPEIPSGTTCFPRAGDLRSDGVGLSRGEFGTPDRSPSSPGGTVE